MCALCRCTGCNECTGEVGTTYDDVHEVSTLFVELNISRRPGQPAQRYARPRGQPEYGRPEHGQLEQHVKAALQFYPRRLLFGALGL